MIYIEKNSTNNIVLTVNEFMVYSDNYVLIRFINECTKEVSYALLKDNLSTYDRWDKYEIEETNATTSLDPENGVVNLSPTGFYIYDCYEFDPNSHTYTNLDALVLTLNHLETGRLRVYGEDEDLAEVYK